MLSKHGEAQLFSVQKEKNAICGEFLSAALDAKSARS
jgi:hypothetical protein